MKRYIKIECDTGYAGTLCEEYLCTEMTDEVLAWYAAERARENAESYEYMVYGWGEDAESYAESEGISVEEAEGMMKEYYAEVCGSWEEISEAEYLANI